MNENKEKVRLVFYAHAVSGGDGHLRQRGNPFAVVTLLANNPREQPRILGRTETIQNASDPRWIKCFDLEFEFTKSKRINVAVFDEISKGKEERVGSAVFEIGEVLGTLNNVKAKRLGKSGSIFARITRVPDDPDQTVNVKLRGVDLKTSEGISNKPDTFFELAAQASSLSGGSSWLPVIRSKPVKCNANPNWDSFSVSISRVCGGDFDKPVQFNLFSYKETGKHFYMGTFESSINGLCQAARSNTPGGLTADSMYNINSFMTKKSNEFFITKKGKHFGKICVEKADIMEAPPKINTWKVAADKVMTSNGFDPLANVHPSYSHRVQSPVNVAIRPSFVEYLLGGCEIELTIAIDYTGSNGDPRTPGTLHYIRNDGVLNEYEKAVIAVGGVIGRYDSDQKFPVLGFGAKYGGVIKHCFQVGREAELSGLGSVLQAYRQVFKTGLTLSGPTVFSEVIDYTARVARRSQEDAAARGKQSYRVLLILTDGSVSDFEHTKLSLMKATDAPLSVVIVGIGNENFANMRALDDFADGDKGYRDICQFVEFSKYKDDKSALATATLEEIPDQLVDFFYGKGISPMPAAHVNKNDTNNSFSLEENLDIPLNIKFTYDGVPNLMDYQGCIYRDNEFEQMQTILSPQPNISVFNAPENQPISIPSLSPVSPSTTFPDVMRTMPPSPPIHRPTIPAQNFTNPSPITNQTDIRRTMPPSPPIHRSTIPAENFIGNQTEAPMSSNILSRSQNLTQSPMRPEAIRSISSSNLTTTSQRSYPSTTLILSNTDERVFRVQVPANGVAGAKMRIQNPYTGNDMVVKIPEGVPPGGTFGVRHP